MTNKITQTEIYKLFSLILQIPEDKLNPKASLIKVYKFDSLTFMELEYLLEDILGVRLDLEYSLIKKLHTAEDFANYILGKM